MKTLEPLDSLSMEELEALEQGLNEDRQEIAKQQRLVQAALSKKVTEESARRKIELMSEDEKQMLAKLISPVGIDSNESVSEV